MQPEIKVFPSFNREAIFTSILTQYNRAIGTVRRITNVSTLPLSRLIHQCLPAAEPLLEKTREDFENDSYPYKYYIDLFAVMKIMKSKKVKRLLIKLHQSEKNKTSAIEQATQDFIELSGIARGTQVEVNLHVYNKLVQILQKAGGVTRAA